MTPCATTVPVAKDDSRKKKIVAYTITMDPDFISKSKTYHNNDVKMQKRAKGVFEKTLPNGARIFWMDARTANPCIGFVSVSFSVGSESPGATQPEIAHFSEHMLAFLTSPQCPDGKENNQRLATEGLQTNAWTSPSRTAYHAAGSIEALQNVYMPMLESMLAEEEIQLDETRILSELKSVVKELETRKDASWTKTSYCLYNHMYPNTQVCRSLDDRIAYVNELIKDEARAKKEVVDFVKSYYTPDRCVISLSSHKKAQKSMLAHALGIANSLAGATGDVRKPVLPKDLITTPLWQTNRVIAVEEPQASTARCIVVHKLNNLTEADAQRDDRTALSAMTHNLAGDLSSRLMMRLRDELGLVYGVGASLEFGDTNPNIGFLIVQSQCAPDKVSEVIQEVSSAVQRIREHGLTNEELVKFKNHALPRIQASSANSAPSSVCNAYDEQCANGRVPYTADMRCDDISRLEKDQINRVLEARISKDAMAFIGCRNAARHVPSRVAKV